MFRERAAESLKPMAGLLSRISSCFTSCSFMTQLCAVLKCNEAVSSALDMAEGLDLVRKWCDETGLKKIAAALGD